MTIYYTLLGFIASLFYFDFSSNKVARNILYWLLVLVIVLFAGTRFDTGYDYWSYYENYVLSQDLNNVYILGKEKLLYIFFYFCHRMNFTFPIVLFITTAVSIVLKVTFIKKYSNYIFLSLLLYVSNFLLVDEMGQVRHALATGLQLFSIKYIIEKKSGKFFLVNIVAFGFHYSSIVFMVSYYIIQSTLLRKSSVCFLFLFLSLIIYYINAFSNIISYTILFMIPDIVVYKNYLISVLENTSDTGILTPGLLWSYVTFALLQYKAKYLIRYVPNFNILMNIFLIGIILKVSFSSINPIGSRIAQPFLLTSVLLIPNLIKIFRPKLIALHLIVAIIFLFSTLKFGITLVKRTDDFIPYKSSIFN